MEQKEKYNSKSQDEDFEWFLSVYDELYAKYGHKFFAIRNKEILGIYDDANTAIDETSKQYPLGQFIVQEDTGDKRGYTVTSGYFDVYCD